MGPSRPSHLASLAHAGKAHLEAAPGKDGPNHFHVPIRTLRRSNFLVEIQENKTGLPWHQRAQR